MFIQIKIFLAKRAFKKHRGDIYDLIAANFSSGGSRKVATTSELFEAWADRETARNNLIGLVYRDIANRLDGGQTLYQALSPFIPKGEVLIIEAGEAHGKLVEALGSVKKQKEANSQINSLVLAAMASPAQSILNVALTSYVAGAFLWTDILRSVEEKYWEPWALYLVHFEIAFAKYWQISAILILVAWLYWWSIPRWTGYVRSFFDRIAPWSIYRDQQSAIFLSVLGGLMAAGMELDAALARIERGSNPWLQWHIRRIRKKLLTAGANPLKALNTGLFSNSILDLIEDSARNRTFDQTLSHLGTDALPIIVNRVKVMAAITSGLLVAFTGLLFMYQVAVQQIGVNDAANKFMATQLK